MGNLILGFLIVDFVILVSGVLLIFSPDLCDRMWGWPFRLIRRKKDRARKEMTRRRRIVYAVFGLLMVAWVVSDWWGIHVAGIGKASASNVTGPSIEPQLAKEVDGMVGPMITSGKWVGAVVGVVDGNKTSIRGYGWTAVGSGRHPDSDTIYEIGSITKTFTATCLAEMCVNGEVSLDTPVGELLSKSVKVPDYKGRKIELKDLATHASSLPTVPSNMSLVSLMDNPYDSYTPDDLYRYLGEYTLTRSPGKQYEYSNIGMGLLGLSLSRKNQTSYEQMVQSIVCKPLGLEDTSTRTSKEQSKRLAQGYAGQLRIGKMLIAVPEDNWTFQDSTAGAGAVRSTARDMTRYISANMGIIQTPLREAMDYAQEPRFKTDVEDMQIGLAWHMFGIGKRNDLVHWHNGETGGYHCFTGFSKSRKIGIVILTNTTTDSDKVDVIGFKLIKYMLERS